MNGFSSSPPPNRKMLHSNFIARGRDDPDELTDPDTPYKTQATQIVPRTTLGPGPIDLTSSPPRSNIEVPASSPFSAIKTGTQKPIGFGNRLAPAGTTFRPPSSQAQTQPRGQKRPATEPILIESDDEVASPSRSEIRPTLFKKQISRFEYVPEGRSSSLVDPKKVDQVKNLTGNIYPTRACEDALRNCHDNVNDAVGFLLDGDHLDTRKKAQDPPAASSFQKKPRSLVQTQTKPYNSPMASRSPSPVKAKPRRRLMQGRRPGRSPSPQFSPAKTPLKPVRPESPEKVIVIEDNDEDYDVEDGSEKEDELSGREKVLKIINDSPLEDLAAMTNIKMDDLKLIGEKRPFSSLSKAERVALPQKPGSRKSSKVAVGETLVDRLQEFTKAVSAIDSVVSECETRAARVKNEVALWNMNFRGHTRSTSCSGASTPTSDHDPLLTPRSLKSQSQGLKNKLRDPPIPTQPALMDASCTMRPFQLFGLNWMKVLYRHKFGCILADEMGLGKTCQVISLMAHLVESYDERDDGPRPWPNLIVVPPSTLSNWEAEFEKFAPELSVLTYQGSQSVRQELAEEMLDTPYHVVLTSYTQIGKEEDIEAMRELKPNAAIFDEGHKMKNMKTKIYKDLVRVKANWRMLLTGTPVQNNLKEMLALLNFIDPALFKGHLYELDFIFGQKVTTRDVNNGAFLYSERISRARNILEPFILQRRKDQVLTDMPKKTCNVVYCDLVSSQKELYAKQEAQFKSGGSELQQPELRHLIGELKNCSDFELHLWCRDYACIRHFDIADGSWLESGKVTKLLELIHQYQQNGDRVLVFSKFAKVIDILREVLHTDGIDHCVLQGATSVDERQGLINEFNNNTDKTVFLLTTGAGGTGINLTSANKVIIFDQSDNPQDDIQAENRAHRLGQTRDVEIIRLLTKDTIEELIYKACSKKIELANKVTGATVEDMGKEAEATLEKEVRKMFMEGKTTPS
ncbi:helicase SWR1 [Plectosphaerella plurivora]|uniref:Helicase SWR1 n=1 Tax=Plectosphaerella plurivora TaxID=936078 RepID=A0A9P8VHF1_9PEZI|nr:helicase SWR1 [Plectosphaerella plurivora]